MDTVSEHTIQSKQITDEALAALWFRGSVRLAIGFVLGSFLTWAAMTGYAAATRRCRPVTIVMRWPVNKEWIYEAMDGTRAVSKKEYQIGDLVCF